MTKTEFVEWRRMPATEEILELVTKLIEDGKDELASSAGQDPVRDRYIVGKIVGLRTILEMEYEEND